MEQQEERKKCNRCHVNLPISHFEQKRNGDICQRCKECNSKNKMYQQQTKCEHGKRKILCKECSGNGKQKKTLCQHGKQKPTCKECGGCYICQHGKQKAICKECGGKQICQHGRQKATCKACGGKQICEHNKQKSFCRVCDPNGYLAYIIRIRVRDALKKNKTKHSIEYLNCDIETFRVHIEKQFVDGMTWENYGEWEIDHIIPLKYQENGEKPTIDEVIKRLHYLNTQPLWKIDNEIKGNRFIGK